jgi:hypothetical protein
MARVLWRQRAGREAIDAASVTHPAPRSSRTGGLPGPRFWRQMKAKRGERHRVEARCGARFTGCRRGPDFVDSVLSECYKRSSRARRRHRSASAAPKRCLRSRAGGCAPARAAACASGYAGARDGGRVVRWSRHAAVRTATATGARTVSPAPRKEADPQTPPEQPEAWSAIRQSSTRTSRFMTGRNHPAAAASKLGTAPWCGGPHTSELVT